MNFTFLPRILALTFLLATIALPTAAQQRTRGKFDNWRNVVDLPTDQKVKVVTLNLEKFRGRLVDVTDDSIVIRHKKAERTIPRDEVARVVRREPKRRRRAVLKRMSIVTAGGALFPVYIEFEERCRCGLDEKFSVPAKAIIGGAIVGSVVGLAAGLVTSPKGTLIYESWESKHAWRGPRR